RQCLDAGVEIIGADGEVGTQHQRIAVGGHAAEQGPAVAERFAVVATLEGGERGLAHRRSIGTARVAHCGQLIGLIDQRAARATLLAVSWPSSPDSQLPVAISASRSTPVSRPMPCSM